MSLLVALEVFPHLGLYIPKTFILNEVKIDDIEQYMVIQAWKKYLSHALDSFLNVFG